MEKIRIFIYVHANRMKRKSQPLHSFDPPGGKYFPIEAHIPKIPTARNEESVSSRRTFLISQDRRRPALLSSVHSRIGRASDVCIVVTSANGNFKAGVLATIFQSLRSDRLNDANVFLQTQPDQTPPPQGVECTICLSNEAKEVGLLKCVSTVLFCRGHDVTDLTW